MENFKKFLNRLNPKFKNPYFFLGLFGTILLAGGVDFATLTSWALLGNALLGIVGNPVAVVSVVLAVLAMWNDNSTDGLDSLKKIKK